MATVKDFLGFVVAPPPGDPSRTAGSDQIANPLQGASVPPSGDSTGTLDTLAINTAATRVAAAGGGNVWLQPGIYTINHTLNGAGIALPSNVWLVGCGRGVTILQLAATAPATGFPILCQNVTNVRLVALELDGNHAANNANSSGVTFSGTAGAGTTKCRVDDCYVHGFGVDGVTGTATAGQGFALEVSAARSEFSNNGSGGLGRGWYFIWATGGTVHDCTANANVQPGIQYDTGSTGWKIVACRCSSNQNAGIASGKTCSDYVIANNYCALNGFWGITGASIQASKFTISGNVCDGNVGGITVDVKNAPNVLNTSIGTSDTTIIANAFPVPPAVGLDGIGYIRIDTEIISYTAVTTTTVTTFTGCTRAQLGTSAAAHTAGATLTDETCYECSAAVTGNTCVNNTGAGINLNYTRGITVTGNNCLKNTNGIATAAAQDATITGNVCRFGSARGITLFNSAQGQWGNNITVEGNVLTNNTTSAMINSVSGTVYGSLAGASTTTAPGAGGAGALPATPKGYVTIFINGASQQVAYY